MLTWDEIQSNAVAFSKKWQKAKSEEAEAQGFLIDFMRVFGVDEPMQVGDFEYKVPLTGGKTGYIDYVWKGKIAIEMKTRGKSLNLAYNQLQTYMQHLPPEDIPDLWLVCDFENMQLRRRSTSEIWDFKKKDLRKHIKKFADIAGYTTERIHEVKMEVNVKAAENMAKLHDALKTHGYEGHDLEVYLVRLLFCMFADDTGIFPQHNFLNYIEQSKEGGSDLAHRISDLFEVLNTSDEKRAKQQLLSDELKVFRYINGALFEERLAPVKFDEKMCKTLIECIKFDWSDISPAIFGAMFKVNVEQFYGIELEHFACQVAQVGMWLIDHQMNLRVSEQFGQYYTRLPLTQSAVIAHGNALRMDWEDVVSKRELAYILGNPPFIGASMMSAEQKADAVDIFGKIRLSNSIDYVGAWYHKAADYMQGTLIKAAFVSTNSITQGEQVAPLWGKMFEKYGVHIDFGYRTFKWGNEAKGKAAVHCVIIGFSTYSNNLPRIIYDSDEAKIVATNINAYLVDAPNVLIASRSRPICDVPIMYLGNKPTDGGNLILSPEEKDILLEREPQAEKLIRRYIGATEFINGKERFCLWLKDVPFSDVKSSPSVLERIERVRTFRLASTAKPTVEKAEIPHLFFFISQPDSEYLLVPSVSSENRKYVPIGYMDKETISSNLNMIVPHATRYHFGVLTSNVHMAWMRAVSGRLKSDYRYTGAITYNNFPWPDATDEQKVEIEILAQAVLDARASYPDSTLADMYNNSSMSFHPALVKAHQNLDKAVWKLYGFSPKTHTSEAAVVASLMERYEVLVVG
jgi:hypothetical protein